VIEGMQRVRIGLTGLAFVFVLVLLAAIFSSPSDEEPITPNSLERQFGNAGEANMVAGEVRKEPLAELGVAPGNADSNNQSNRSLRAGTP
jgi:hypothetical protein